MFLSSLASIIPLVVLLALVVAAARAIWLAVVPPRRCVKEASCEKCKYPVAGLSAWTCPECGSNLLTVGIVTRSMEMRRRGSYVGAIAGLFMIVGMAVLIGLRAVEVTLAPALAPFNRVVVSRSTPLTTGVAGFPKLILQIQQDLRGYGYSDVTVSLRSEQDSFGAVIVGDAIETSAVVKDAAGRVVNHGTNVHQVLEVWLIGAGADATASETGQLASELANYLTSSGPHAGTEPTAADLPSFTIDKTILSSGPTEATESNRTWYSLAMWTVPCLGVLMFAFFSILLIRRRRGLLRDA